MIKMKLYAASLLLALAPCKLTKSAELNQNQVDLTTVIENSNNDYSSYAVVIDNDDLKYLDNVDLDNYSFDTLILNNVYLQDGNKINLDDKTINHLWLVNSVVNSSTIDLNDYNDVNIYFSYNVGEKNKNEKIDNSCFLNPEYQKYYNKCNDRIKKVAKKIRKQSDGSKEDMIRLATLYVVKNLKYDLSYLNDDKERIMNSIFEDKRGVCVHYMSLETRLLRELGIYSLDIIGYTNPEKRIESAHAWNMVYLDGNWYSIDPTWLDNKKGIKDLKNDNDNKWYMASIDDEGFNCYHYPYFKNHNLIPKEYLKVK